MLRQNACIVTAVHLKLKIGCNLFANVKGNYLNPNAVLLHSMLAFVDFFFLLSIQ